jgi:hypothetical protein
MSDIKCPELFWRHPGTSKPVSCADCENNHPRHRLRCGTCYHNKNITADFELKDNFYPLLSCHYCNSDSCGYRHVNPCYGEYNDTGYLKEHLRKLNYCVG